MSPSTLHGATGLPTLNVNKSSHANSISPTRLIPVPSIQSTPLPKHNPSTPILSEHLPFPSTASLIATSSIHTVSNTTSPPLCRPPPQYYPAFARRLGQYGKVLVRLTLHPTGRIQEAVLQRSSGFISLDRAALAMARQASCLASTEAVPRYTTLQFQFDLVD